MNVNYLLNTKIKDLELPELPYDLDSLEPTISERIMNLHYNKHHAGYLKKLQSAVTSTEYEEKSLVDVLKNLSSVSDKDLQNTIRNSGGGYYNHYLFWMTMTPEKETPSGNIAEKIEESFNSVDNFKEKFTEAASGVFGSGWAWLVQNTEGSLEITSTPNQNNPLMDVESSNGVPILGLDVWEHAYYIDYENRRGEYIEKWWDVVNWSGVNEIL